MEIKLEQLQKYSLFVGVPMYGGMCTGLYAKSSADLAALCAKYGIRIYFYYLFNESLIQRARNYVVDMFMETDYTHLMFIDADIGFDANHVISLLGIQTSNPSKYNVVTAAYPKKTIAWEKIQKIVNEKVISNPSDLAKYGADFAINLIKGTTSFRLDEPLEISEAGTGFMLIPRETFLEYKKNYPQYLYKPDHLRMEHFNGTREIMAYFDCEIDPVSRRYLSEDYFFCRNVREIGMSIYMCPWIPLLHVGTYTYKGDMVALANLENKKVDKTKSKYKMNKQR